MRAECLHDPLHLVRGPGQHDGRRLATLYRESVALVDHAVALFRQHIGSADDPDQLIEDFWW